MTLQPVGTGTSITTGTASQQSEPIAGKSTAIRIFAASQNTFVAIGTNPTATTNDFAIPSGTVGTIAFSNTSAVISSISTATTYTYINFTQGTSSPFQAGDYVSVTSGTQDYYDFTHKRVKQVYSSSSAPNYGAGENWFSNRIVVENDYGRNISTSLVDRGGGIGDATMRGSLKVAAITDSGSGKAYIQQVQIAGDA